MMRSRFRQPTFWLLAAIVALAALLRFRALRFGLPHTQARPDETAIIDPVLKILSGQLPRFYDYPWLFLWIVSLAYLGYYVWGSATGAFRSLKELVASWPIRWEPFFVIPRVISATLGTVSVLLIYRLGRLIRDEATGLVSALFLTVNFMHVMSSHFGTTDVTMTCLILLALTLLVDAHQTRRRRTFAAAGLAAGLAAATKYNAIFLLVPMAVSYLITVYDATPPKRQAFRDPGILFFSGGFLVTFAIGIPFVILDREPFMNAMGELAHALRVGDVHQDLTNGWVHHLVFSLRYGMGLPLLVAGVAGAATMLWLEPRKALIFLSFPAVYYAIAGSFRLLFFRYAMPVIPFLCVTAAYLVCRVSELAIGGRSAAGVTGRATTGSDRRALLHPLAGAIAIALAASSAVRAWQLDRVLGQADNRVVLARWFLENVPGGSSVLQSGSRYGLAQFWDRRITYQEWRWDGGRNAFLLDGRRTSPDARPDWIVVQDSPLPSTTQDIVKTFLKEDYALVADFHAFDRSDALVYDSLDAFFVPFSGLEHVARPGPNFTVYRRGSRDGTLTGQ